MTSEPVPLTVAPITVSPGCFSTGIDSPVTIDSSTELMPSSNDAIDRHLLAGTHTQTIARMNPIERHVFFGAVVAHDARGFRRQVEQRAHRSAGATSSAKLQHLSEEDQRDDGGGRFEIDADLTAVRHGRNPETASGTPWRPG